MSSQITNMLFVLALVQLVKFFDLASPKNATLIRIIYGAAQIAVLATLAFIRSSIIKANLKGSITVNVPAKPFSGEEDRTETISIKENDSRELNMLLQQTLFSLVMLVVFHLWLKALQPLIFQSILPIKNLITNQLFQIYVLNRKAEGSLERPWKEPNPFADLMPKEAPVDDEPNGIVELNEEEVVEKIEAVKKSEEEPLLKNRKKTSRKDE
jgi:hypothetical protein